MTDDKALVIEKILKIRKENEELQKQVSDLEESKSQLLSISEELQAIIADKAARELESLHNERAYISQKSIQEEEELKNDFQKKYNDLKKEEVELEHRLEAESEFVSRTLRKRLLNIHAKAHQLRDQLNQKSREVAESLLNMTSDEALRTVIQNNQDACLELSSKISESHREIEGMQAKAERLKTILDHLQNKINDRKAPSQFGNFPFEEHRRKSYTHPVNFGNL